MHHQREADALIISSQMDKMQVQAGTQDTSTTKVQVISLKRFNLI